MGSAFSCYSSRSTRGSQAQHDVYYSKLEMRNNLNFTLKENLRFNLSAGELKLLFWIWEQLKIVNKGLIMCRLFEMVFQTCPEIKRFFGLVNVANEKALVDERMVMHMLIMQDTVELIINSLSYDNEQLGHFLVAFGCQHSFYTRRGFDPKYWNVFGDAFLRLLDDVSLKAFRKFRAKTVWSRFVFFLISHMQVGYGTMKRKRMCRRNAIER